MIALAASGRGEDQSRCARQVQAPPADQERDPAAAAPDGTYAGPIVVAEKEHGERAIVGIKAGAKLGRIEVNPADGYAELATRLPASTSTSSARPSPSREPRWAPATSAESASTGGSAPGDGDLDGVPNAVDVDDDGDVILDRFDPESGTAAVRAPTATPVVRAICWTSICRCR